MVSHIMEEAEDVGGADLEDVVEVEVEFDGEAYSPEDGESDQNESDDEEGLNEIEIENMLEARRKERCDLDNGVPYFRIGMTFSNMKDAKFAIDDYSASRGYDIRLKKSDKTRVRVYCFDCSFNLYIGLDHGGPTVLVKSVTPEHSCFPIFANKRATTKWLAVKFMDKVLERPSYSSGDMLKDAKSIFKVDVSNAKCVRAKQLILEKLDGSYKQEYATLEAYASECMITNPGSLVKVDVAESGGRRVFKRIFVCFDALKKGWKAGCRPIIGFDGCFLKGICKGVLLVACGRDANDHFYPIAWAVVDKENGVNWEWFIHHLKIQLELGNGADLAIISDMQKGLLPAVAKFLSEAEHRWCARHIHANWSKKWRGGELTKLFWICSWSTYQEEFKDNLKKLGSISKEAAEHLVSYPPQKWCRAYYSSRSKDMIVTSNHVESFNAWIKLPREKSIYRLLDEVRLNVIDKLTHSDKEASKWKNEWSPKCMKVYNINLQIAALCKVNWNGDEGYEVSEGSDRHCVMLDRKLCTCREWELSGIPCPHAICALRHKRIDPMKEISMFYHVSTFKKTYSFKLQPVRGKPFWNVDLFQPILPPPIVKMPGRPRKKRIREATEPNRQNQTLRLTRVGHKKKCTKCGGIGHNKLSCTWAPPVTLSSGPGESLNASNVGSSSNSAVPNEPLTAHTAQPSTELPRHTTMMNSDQQYEVLRNRFNDTIRRSHNSSGAEEQVPEEQTLDCSNLNEIDAEEAAMADLVLEVDAEVNFPIPSEHETRIEMRTIAKEASGTRKIAFVGEGVDALTPTDLPFERPGFMWKGKKAVSRQGLEAQREKQIGKTKAKKLSRQGLEGQREKQIGKKKAKK